MASLIKLSYQFSKSSVVGYNGGLFGRAREIEKKYYATSKFLSSFLGEIQRIISPTVMLIPMTQRITENISLRWGQSRKN